MIGEPLPFRIEHTRNRQSRAVYLDDTVIIRLAHNLRPAEERLHIASLLKRISRRVERERCKAPIDPFRLLLTGTKECLVTTAHGSHYRFVLMSGAHAGAKRSPDGWTISTGPELRPVSLHRLLWRLLAVSEAPYLQHMVEEWNARTLRVPLKAVRCRFTSSQWGSCSHRGTITLSAALLFLPQRLLTYVIVHELAHIRHRNHSSAYWRTVEEALPTAQEDRALLKNYRLPSLSAHA